MTKLWIVLLLLVVPSFAIDTMPKVGVLGSRFVYPQRGLIGAYPVNEGTGLTLTDYSASLGYRNSGTNTNRCGNLPITLSGGSATDSFTWNPAPENLANRPLRAGVLGVSSEIGFHLGGTNNYGTSASGVNDYITVPCGGSVKTAVFIIRAQHDSNASGASAPEGNGIHPLLGGDGVDNPIGFDAGQFGATLYKASQAFGGTNIDWQGYWNNSDGSQNLHCIGDDVVLVLTNPGSALTKAYCNGVEIPYKGGLATMSKLWLGTSAWYIGREDYATFGNYRYNQPMTRNIQWMSFHSVALTQQEVLQATNALRYRQRKFAKQPPLYIGIVGDSISDECSGPTGSAANQCPTGTSPNGTTISGSMDATQTSITFPSGNGVISYDSGISTGGYIRVSRTEYMKITSCTTSTSATTCTVQRGCKHGVCSGTGTTHTGGDYVQTSWAIQLRAALQNDAHVVNAAVIFYDDQTMRQLGMKVSGTPRYYEGTNINAEFDKAQSGIYGRKIIIGQECINALNGGRSAAQIEQTTTAWADEHRKAGYQVFWATCNPMGSQLATTSGGTLPGGSTEPSRQSINTWARANALENAVTIGGTGFSGPGMKGLIDLEVDSTFAPDHCENSSSNSQYPPCSTFSNPTIPYRDNTSHLTSVGSYRMMQRVLSTLNASGIF